jgi:hypothetical protein
MTHQVILTLHPFDKVDDAMRVADDIRNTGTVSYTDNSGSTVNVTVGDVAVTPAPST